MSRYLLDTNHISALIRPVSPLRDRVHMARKQGHVFGVCIPVLGELEVGIDQTVDPPGNRRRLRQLLAGVKQWPLDLPVARHYAAIFAELRQKGRVMSQVDMFLAALCRHMKVTMLTTDRDFEALPDIRTENWLAEPAAPSA